MKYMQAEKEEQFRCAKDKGAFRTQAGKDAMIKRFKAVVDRHRNREQARNQMLLGTKPYSNKFKSKRYDEHVANIRENCRDDVSGNVFRALIENYHDKDYFSTDMDQRIDQLVAFGYAGTTVMRSRMPSGTGSGLSESSMEAPAPFVDLWVDRWTRRHVYNSVFITIIASNFGHLFLNETMSGQRFFCSF